jgi:hypothetical protein
MDEKGVRFMFKITLYFRLIACYKLYEEFALNFSNFTHYDTIFEIACYVALKHRSLACYFF